MDSLLYLATVVAIFGLIYKVIKLDKQLNKLNDEVWMYMEDHATEIKNLYKRLEGSDDKS